MKNRRLIKFYVLCSVLCVLQIMGCGYTTKSLLPANIKTVYIENFKNDIDLTEESSNKNPYTLYSPGIENEVTRAAVDRFIYDGHFKIIKDKEAADSVLSGEVKKYVKEPLRYDANDNVTEYRVRVAVGVKFTDSRDDKVIWESKDFSGESSQKTTGAFTKTEETARAEAVDDLTRRILEKIIEVW